jgi:ParB family chromosome partitioning protein
MNKSRGLGKGLGALIPNFEEVESSGTPQEVELRLISTNPYQPRKEFDPEKLAELTESIKVHGIIQPLLVREFQNDYQLIAGERRLRAAKQAGLETVPVIIREMSDETMMEVALVENLQREDLNPIEEAEAYHRLGEEFSLTQDEIARRVSKSRPAVANALRLLNLPKEIQTDLSSGVLSAGHARALLSLKTPIEQTRIWTKTKTLGLSVREIEELVRAMSETGTVSRETKKAAPGKVEKDPNLREIEEELQQALGTKVTIVPGSSGGRIEIQFYSGDDLERICEMLFVH